MRVNILPIAASLFVISLAGCAIIPDLPPSATPTPQIPPTGYEPQAGDKKFKRDQVYLDMVNSTVTVRESMPVQVTVTLNGNLSDPCHQLRVVISPPNAQKEINLEVYSLYNPELACITVLKPFTATIELGSFTGGHFTVFANGQLIGEFDA